jgi:ribosomal protein S18 acetylase RimI-like enzyme
VERRLRKAGDDDVERLTDLINRAYGPAESFLYNGPRITAAEVRQKLRQGAFLVLEGPDSAVRGCVHVQCRGQLGYFGLLAVAPAHQGSGVAQSLIGAAEQFCREGGCHSLEIDVVNHRRSLLDFYAKYGYRVTGERPFDLDILRMPSHFLILSKPLRANPAPA